MPRLFSFNGIALGVLPALIEGTITFDCILVAVPLDDVWIGASKFGIVASDIRPLVFDLLDSLLKATAFILLLLSL